MKTIEAGDAILRVGDPRLKPTDIDRWYEVLLGNEKPKVASRPYLYGSDAGFCARRNVLLENNDWIDGDVNAAGRGYMAIGVAFENLLAESLMRNDRLIVQSMRLVPFPQFKISGKIDLVVFDQRNELALIEVKTCGDLPTEPKPTHLAQIQTYAAVSGIHNCYLTYMSRNLNPLKPIPMRSFQVDTSDEALVGVLSIAALSRLAIAEKVLPPVPAHFRKHTECHYCEFRDYFCHGQRPGKGGDAPVSPLPPLEGGALIKMMWEARELARGIFAASPHRRKETIRLLQELVPDESWMDYRLRTLQGEK